MKLPDRERALHLLQQMIRIRRFEEKSAELYSAGKIRGFLHLYIGEEAIAVGMMEAFRPRLQPSWTPYISAMIERADSPFTRA